MTDSNISSRKRAIQNDLGVKDGREDAQIEISLANEQARRCKKEMRRKEIRRSVSYRMVEDIAKWMDKYFLDAILGFVPSVGDSLTSLAALPSIYVSLFKVKSVPLTLAVIFNILGWAMNKRGFALTGAILYTVALVLMPLYFMFVIIQMILSYVGFAKLKTIIAANTAQTANTQSGNEM